MSDDVPVTACRYTESLAELIGARRPLRMPGPLAHLALGGVTGLLTVSHRVSNRRFRAATGWAPEVPSVIEGWPVVGLTG